MDSLEGYLKRSNRRSKVGGLLKPEISTKLRMYILFSFALLMIMAKLNYRLCWQKMGGGKMNRKNSDIFWRHTHSFVFIIFASAKSTTFLESLSTFWRHTFSRFASL